MKELIRKILKEDYSPAGKEIIPNEIVVHKSNPMFRDNIMSEGLKVKTGECYRIYVGYGEKCIPAIFATNSKNKRAWFHSTYDDDIWFIDTTKIPDVKWFKDRHYESTKKHIVTFQDIPRDAITLFYEGTGKSDEFVVESNLKDDIQKNIKVINLILSEINWDGLCDIWVEYNKDENLYEIRSKTTKSYFEHDEIEKELEYLENTLISMGIRPYIYHPWYIKDCEDDVEFLNESKQNSKKDLILKVLNDLVLPQYEHIICGFELKNVDDESLNSVINYPGVIVKMIGGKGTRMWPNTPGVQKMYDDLLDEVWDTVWDYTGISLELYKKLVKDCGSENINESEESKQEIKFTKLLNNIEEYLNSNSYNSVVRFMVDYDEVMDDVIVNIFFDAEHAVKLGGGIYSVIKKTGQKLMEDLIIFPFDFKYHIHFEKPQLNESKGDTNYLPIIEEIIEPFKEDECICDIDMWYDDEDDMYSVYLVFGTEELNDKFTSDGKFGYVRKKQKEVEETIKSYLPIKNIYVGSYGTPHCGWKPLNEKHKVSKDEYIELYRDNDFVLTIPLTHDASKKYGSDTKWCTTTKECSKKFNDHKKYGVLGYITVRDNQLKNKLNNNAFALYRLYGDDNTRTIVFDDENNEYRNGEQWLANKFDIADKLFQFYKMLEKFNSYFESENVSKEPIFESKELEKNNENIVPSDLIPKIEKVINKSMSNIYDWWKEIEINSIKTSGKPFHVLTIYGKLKVDEEWGANQWKKYYDTLPFPGNDEDWEERDYKDVVTLGDLTGYKDKSSENIKEDITTIINMTTNLGVKGMQLSTIELIFI